MVTHVNTSKPEPNPNPKMEVSAVPCHPRQLGQGLELGSGLGLGLGSGLGLGQGRDTFLVKPGLTILTIRVRHNNP